MLAEAPIDPLTRGNDRERTAEPEMMDNGGKLAGVDNRTGVDWVLSPMAEVDTGALP